MCVVELVHAANYKRVCFRKLWVVDWRMCRRYQWSVCVGGDRDAVFVYISCVINHTFIDLIYHCGIQSCVHCNSMADGTHVCFLSMGYPIYYLCPHDLFKQGHTRHVSTDGLSLKGELLLQYCIRVSCSTFAIWRTSFFDGRDTSHFIL